MGRRAIWSVRARTRLMNVGFPTHSPLVKVSRKITWSNLNIIPGIQNVRTNMQNDKSDARDDVPSMQNSLDADSQEGGDRADR